MDLSQELIEHFIPLESICHSILEGVMIIDSNKKFLFWNKSAKKILADVPDSVDPNGWAFRYNLFNVETHVHLKYDEIPMIKALNGETFQDYRIMTKTLQNPEGMILSVNGNPIRNGPATVAAIVTFRDITEQVKLQKENVLNKEMYERMLDLMPCVVYVKDLEGVYIYGNQCLLDIFKVDSVKGHHCREYLPKSVAEFVLKNDALVTSSGKSHVFTENITLNDGRKINFHSIRFPFKDSNGEITGVCAVSEVLTDQPSF